MSAHKGYYSLIQFCPAPSRLEVVNVGVVLLVPDANYLRAEVTRRIQRAKKIVPADEFDAGAFKSALTSLAKRFSADRGAFSSLEDLRSFISKRANSLVLTEPRPIKVWNAQQEHEKLFEELVGGIPSRERKTGPTVPALDRLFQLLHQQGRAQLNKPVEVPVLGSQLRVPYAYQNGQLQLVKPEKFSADRSAALRSAGELAIRGDLIQKHSVNGQDAQLIVIPTYYTSADLGDVPDRIAKVLAEYKVRVVSEDGMSEFAREVEREAHP